jgi:DNA modification methylase
MPTYETANLRNQLVEEFSHLTGISVNLTGEYATEVSRLLAYVATKDFRAAKERTRAFLGHVNAKFRLNAEPMARFFAEAASHGITFHYHHKRAIQLSFDTGSLTSLGSVLAEKSVSNAVRTALSDCFEPVSANDTLEHLKRECAAPSKLRIEKGERDIAKEIGQALFASFLWALLPEKEMHRFFDTSFREDAYEEDFWRQLHILHPDLFSRENALHIVRINQQLVESAGEISNFRNAVSNVVAEAYTAISNYGFLALLIEPLVAQSGRRIEWECVADIMLFGEKHRESPLDKSYFRWKKIEQATHEYVSGIDTRLAEFRLANEGFSYRDCFVATDADGNVTRLLLLMQKNERDETVIPCPACRSSNVQGNSYSSLGVRSWECNNPLCLERSKYNRGKRYSLRALMMQEAIDDPANTVPRESVRRWVRDVVEDANDGEIAEMLIRHYSMFGDHVHVFNWPEFSATNLGRTITSHPLSPNLAPVPFWNGSFFHRYIVPRSQACPERQNLGDDLLQIYCGEAASVLKAWDANSFDGAVTSPPYYNAREYSQWPNIYCYLNDMFAVNAEVFRTLKPGAIYLYNIFDYFDNENSVVFSAMGQKRMILSAYTVDLFRRIGFDCVGNLVWDKGDIEGKRGFNAGNFSPFYQSPFNCWEHILVFQKPDRQQLAKSNATAQGIGVKSSVFRCKPVMKMVRGTNVHGHTAPFPDELPGILVTMMQRDSVVLDPFAGSLTTGRVAARQGVQSVCIERSQEYCELGLRLRKEENDLLNGLRSQRELFDLESLPASSVSSH